MTDQLLLDFDRAFELHVTMTGVADELDTDRNVLAGLFADAERFLGVVSRYADDQLRAAAELLRSEGDDLARRLRMIALGGPEINAGLAALEAIRANWDLIDNKGDVDGNDGVVSRSDLEWAAEHLDGDAADAARWLLDHPDFFAAVETAKQNSDYLANGGAGFAAADGDSDGKLSIGDIDSYLTKLDTWATLVPYMASIDVAAHGGDLDGFMSKADFEAFLDDQTLPPQVRQAAQQVLDDSAFHESGGIGWDDVLMVASFIPVVGDFIDAAMALYYLAQGDWEQAALSGIGLIPIPGFTGATTRGAKAAAEEVAEEFAEEAIERTARETADDLAEGIAATGRRTDGSFDPDNLAPQPATTTASKTPDPDDLTPTPATASAANGAPGRVPEADDLAQVPAMSGARRADNATEGPPPANGGSGSTTEPPPPGNSASTPRNAQPHGAETPPQSSTPPVAGPNTELTPGGGLSAHEAAGGHTIERHVDQSMDDLAQRLATEKHIPAASTFTSRAAAEESIASTLEAKKGAIQQWLRNGAGNSGSAFTASFDNPIGISLVRGASGPTPAATVRVVLRPDASMPGGYRILTAFPE